ncbi:MAG: hypothetical protein DBY08_01735 [Clostridiales bacterium]|nr:MAG: hypothetical protein DBY08_01735 [Clostridiales bacterium]
MNKKKKTIIAAIAIISIAAIGCAAFYFIKKDTANKPPTLEETVENRISAYETDLRDSLASMTDQSLVADYLANWGKNKGLNVKTDKYGNVIFSINATEGMESKAPAVIVCGYDYSSMNSYIDRIVSTLVVAKNDRPHGNYKVIFTSEENGSLTGAENLSSKYFEDDCEIFFMGGASTSRISTVTGGYEEYLLSKSLSYKTPSYSNAYKITLSGLPAEKLTTETSSAPNLVKILGNQLANLKSDSIWFELADFEGGSGSELLPSSASATIAVSPDISEKLEGKLDRAIEKFYDKYGDSYPQIQYTYEAVATPASVISSDDADAIVSLMYTAMSGIHYKDDNGDIASLTNIGYVSTADKKFNMSVAAYSWDTALLTEISEAYQTTCGLSGFEWNVVSQYAPFTIDESNQPFEVDFREAYNEYQNIKLKSINMPELTPCGILKGKNENTQIIALGITQKTKDNFAGGIITYLASPEKNDVK